MRQNTRRDTQTTTAPSGNQGMQQTYTIHHDFDGTATVTATIVHALSDITGVDVSEAEFVLNDHVDPDALDKLFADKADGTSRSHGHVTINIQGYQTTIYSTGQISIVPPQPQAQTPHQ